MSLLSIPLAAWVVILRHVDERDIVRAFSRIYASGALGVPPFRKLDAFWLVVTQARLHEREAEALMFEDTPDAAPYHAARQTLVEMGLPYDTASNVAGDARGDLQRAMAMLGWSS